MVLAVSTCDPKPQIYSDHHDVKEAEGEAPVTELKLLLFHNYLGMSSH